MISIGSDQESSYQLLTVVRERLKSARFLVAVTGAGISLASGLPLGDAQIGDQSVQRLFDRSFFDEETAAYFNLFRRVLLAWRSAQPNAAHCVLARHGVWVVTQNVDGLHRDAGTERLLELHGNLRELVCPGCTLRLPARFALTHDIPKCPTCSQRLEPGIAFVGDPIRHFSLASDWVGRAEVVLVIGTALEMEPVRQLPTEAEQRGALVLVVNHDAERWVPSLFASD
ncbi:MAG: iron dicitrate transport regulator FecR [Alicyclobacillus sp.]|nr:iron dicitrate transport regulator FecR [Alicyclobacillus sp.]